MPAVQARGKALAVLVEAVGGSFPRPFAPSIRRVDASLDGVTGHLYTPERRSPAVLLLPGAAIRGKDDPRVARLAKALARAGRVVFVPDLILYQRRLDPSDLDRIARAVVAISEHRMSRGPVAVFGISYGGSFALVAAADRRVQGRLAIVAVFGAYFDLIGVIQAVTTGFSVVGGTRLPWEGAPNARALLERHALALAPEASRGSLRAALDRREPAGLDPEVRAVYELLANRDPARTEELAEGLSPAVRGQLSRFSPSSVAERLRVPVVAMHSRDDPAVPVAEALRLARALPEARMVRVGSFRHVDFTSAGPGGLLAAVGDLLDAWRFGAWLIGAQE